MDNTGSAWNLEEDSLGDFPPRPENLYQPAHTAQSSSFDSNVTSSRHSPVGRPATQYPRPHHTDPAPGKSPLTYAPSTSISGSSTRRSNLNALAPDYNPHWRQMQPSGSSPQNVSMSGGSSQMSSGPQDPNHDVKLAAILARLTQHHQIPSHASSHTSNSSPATWRNVPSPSQTTQMRSAGNGRPMRPASSRGIAVPRQGTPSDAARRMTARVSTFGIVASDQTLHLPPSSSPAHPASGSADDFSDSLDSADDDFLSRRTGDASFEYVSHVDLTVPLETWQEERNRGEMIIDRLSDGRFTPESLRRPWLRGIQRTVRILQLCRRDPVGNASLLQNHSRTYREQYENGSDTLMLAVEDEDTIMSDVDEGRLRHSIDVRHSAGKPAATSMHDHPAIACVAYDSSSAQTGSDVWPDIKDRSNTPFRYIAISTGSLLSANCLEPARQELHCNGYAPPLMRRKQRFELQFSAGCESPGTECNGAHDSEDIESFEQPAAPEWPMGRIPVELLEEIASHLSRDDVKALRLTCREFDRNLSRVLFATVVVPFTTEIYGLLRSQKVKGKMRSDPAGSNGNASALLQESHTFQNCGLDVFKGFGPHIVKFGMAFEFDAHTLTRPPGKGTTKGHYSYWGRFQWPHEHYQRFQAIAGLEHAADETPIMTTAFSMLTKVKDLGLSLDNGLGWLNGPDQSIRSRVFEKASPVFGSSRSVPDRQVQAQEQLWQTLQTLHIQSLSTDLRHCHLWKQPLRPQASTDGSIESFDVEDRLAYVDPRLVSQADIDHTHPGSDIGACNREPLDVRGMLYTAPAIDNESIISVCPIIPQKLTKAQREWLLELEWAQRAFLASYMLSIADNPSTFANIRSFTISRLSSRHLPQLVRDDFWDALPSLKAVTVKVIPEWRNVVKDGAGFVDTVSIEPSESLKPFGLLLEKMISPRSNITDLTIGWAAGGAKAEGLHGRGRHALPPPLFENALLREEQERLNFYSTLSLPHLQRLTLSNCWVTPASLRMLLQRNATIAQLCMDSVSLTAPVRPPPAHNANANLQGNLQANQLMFLQQQQAAVQQQIQQAQMLQQQYQQHQQNLVQSFNQHAQLQAPNNFAGGMAHFFQHANGAVQVVQPPQVGNIPNNNQPAPAADRPGSWSSILSHILTHQPSSSISLNSCGYVFLPYADTFDQSIFDGLHGNTIRDPSFSKRAMALQSSMLFSRDELLAEIVYQLPVGEAQWLEQQWGLVMEETSEAEAFDGVQGRYNGRFSGSLTV